MPVIGSLDSQPLKTAPTHTLIKYGNGDDSSVSRISKLQNERDVT